MSPPTPEEIALHFPDLAILKALPTGGMSFVYLVEEKRLGRKAVMKLLPAGLADDHAALGRLRTEARMVARLADVPEVIQIYDFYPDPVGGWPFMRLEYAEQGSLADWAVRTKPSLGSIISLGARLAEGLEKIHKREIAHGDIKPDNLLVMSGGEVKFGDFGLSGFMPHARATHHTPGYTAPEIVAGNTLLTARADVYALAATLAELALPGSAAKDAAERLRLVATLPAPAARVLAAGLEPDPARRTGSAAEFQRALQSLSPVPAAPVKKIVPPRVVIPPRPPAEPPKKRPNGMLALTAATALLVGFGVWFKLSQSSQPLPVQQSATEAATRRSTEAVTKQEPTATDKDEEWLKKEMEIAPAKPAPAPVNLVQDEVASWNPAWKIEASLHKSNAVRLSTNSDAGAKVLRVHPFSRTTPARLTRRLPLPAVHDSALTVRAAADYRAGVDAGIQAFCGNQALGPVDLVSTTMPEGRFRTYVWPLREWKGREVDLRLEVSAAGSNNWNCEFAYLSDLDVVPQAAAASGDPSAQLLAQASTEQPWEGWVDLFSREHIGEWRDTGNGGLWFKKGVGVTWVRPSGASEGAFYLPGRTFADMELQVEFKFEKPRCNSGVQLRIPEKLPRDFIPSKLGLVEVDIGGYEISRFGTGALGWSKPPDELPLTQGDWNRLQVKAQGKSYQVLINGKIVNNWTGGERTSGLVGLQYNRADGWVMFRKLWVKGPLPARDPAIAAMHEATSKMQKFSADLVAEYLAGIQAGRKNLAQTPGLEPFKTLLATDPAKPLTLPGPDPAGETVGLRGVWANEKGGEPRKWTFEPGGKMTDGHWEWFARNAGIFIITRGPSGAVHLGRVSGDNINFVNHPGAQLNLRRIVEPPRDEVPKALRSLVWGEEASRAKFAERHAAKAKEFMEWITRSIGKLPDQAALLSVEACAELPTQLRPPLKTPAPQAEESRRFPGNHWTSNSESCRFEQGGTFVRNVQSLGVWKWARPDCIVFHHGGTEPLTCLGLIFADRNGAVMRIQSMNASTLRDLRYIGDPPAIQTDPPVKSPTPTINPNPKKAR